MARPAARTSPRRSNPSRVSARAKVADLAAVDVEARPAEQPPEPGDVGEQDLTRRPAPRPKGVSTSRGGRRAAGSNGNELCETLLADMKRFECSAVLFDLDGVLVDSTAYVEQQWRRWASARGLRPEPFLRVCHGRRALETIRMAAPHLDAEAEVKAFVPAEEAETGPMAAAARRGRLLDMLPRAELGRGYLGRPANRDGTSPAGGAPLPPVLVCAEDVTRGKPSPDAYLLAARELGVSPPDCLVVEDAPAGVQAARAAGMTVVGLTTTHRVDQLGADACAESLAGVLPRPDGQGTHGLTGWRSSSSSPSARRQATRPASSAHRLPASSPRPPDT